MRKLGPIGQGIFDMFCEGKSADEIEEQLYRYLPGSFGYPSGNCPEKSLGSGKVIDVHAGAYCLAHVNVPDDIDIPDWEGRFNVRAWFQMRYKPPTELKAIMLSTVRVVLSVESTGAPRRRETLFEHKHADIDEAFDDIKSLVIG